MLVRHETFEDEIAKTKGASCVSASQPWVDNIDGYPAAVEILKADPRPTAVFVTMDMLAVGVYRAAAELGLSIPEDLSVIGTPTRRLPVTSPLSSPPSIRRRSRWACRQRNCC